MNGLSPGHAAAKRAMDLVGASLGLLATGWLIAIGWVAAAASAGGSGLFRQERVGRGGSMFTIYKLRTMKPGSTVGGSVTVADDDRITAAGRVLRRFRIDELPQLWNVLRGDMSLVGPRPDVPGFADRLRGDDRVVLSVRPGITGPATLAFRDETELLAAVPDPEAYNRDVIYPAKVSINVAYVRDYSILKDVGYILMTLVGARIDRSRFTTASEVPR